jgi:signal transduction histidine kinase
MVLELHRGTIEVDSSEGVGSTFAVHLPAAGVAAGAAEDAAADTAANAARLNRGAA